MTIKENCMGRLGFDLENEFLPSFDKFQTMRNQRLMFLKFFNQEVSCDIRFSKEELKDCKEVSLFNIFAKKIIKNLQFDSYVSTSLKEVDVEKTNKINSFYKKLDSQVSLRAKRFSILNSLSVGNIDISLKLINILEECKCSFFLDGEKIFKNFVSHKVLRSDGSREVYVNSDSIDVVTKENDFCTKIFTFWEFLDSSNLQIQKHIDKAVKCIETSEFKQVYLVYPKNEKFNKHIRIKTNDLRTDEYEIKLVPYSLRSTLR